MAVSYKIVMFRGCLDNSFYGNFHCEIAIFSLWSAKNKKTKQKQNNNNNNKEDSCRLILFVHIYFLHLEWIQIWLFNLP